MERIYLSPPDMTDAERTALMGAFDSGWVAPVGPDLSAFEAEMCDFLRLGEGGAAALSSGTAALHLGLLIAGVGRDDEVWTSTLTFAATANAVTYVGARPVFIDADPDTWQMDPVVLSDALDRAAARDQLPAAVIPVDLYGQSCDYDQILTACARHGVPVIEDAAEGLGTTYRDRRAGTFGQTAALSFNGNKLITTGGGGMLLSTDPDHVARARHLATQAKQPVMHYEHTETGFNYRLSNLLAALGRAQLARVPQLIARRAQIRQQYVAALSDIDGISFMPIADYGEPNHWLTCILLDRPLTVTPYEVCTALAAEQIEARPLWKPMHLQPVFAGHRLLSRTWSADKGSVAAGSTGSALAGIGTSGNGGSPVADDLFARGLCLPSGSVLTDVQQEWVVMALRRTLGAP